jgi:predicted SnoaL-like aldol condensation-catalyzing enzyme
MISNSNKELIREFYKKVFVEHDSEWVTQHVKEDYIQHSPHLPSGRPALLQSLDYLKHLPKSNSARPSFCLIEDKDFVASLWYAVIGGTRKAIVDLFRIQQGQLAEHWDATAESVDEPMQVTSSQFNDTSAIRKSSTRFVEQRDPSAQIIRTVAEQNTAMVQSRSANVDGDMVIYTFITFANNVIVDFREVSQRIPDSMPHDNGMI